MLIHDVGKCKNIDVLGVFPTDTDEVKELHRRYGLAIGEALAIERTIFEMHSDAINWLCAAAEKKKMDSTNIYLGGVYVRQIFKLAPDRHAYATESDLTLPGCFGSKIFEFDADVRVAIMNGLATVRRLDLPSNPELDKMTRNKRTPKPCEERDKEFTRLSESGMADKEIAAAWNRKNPTETVTDQVVRTARSRFRNNM